MGPKGLRPVHCYWYAASSTAVQLLMGPQGLKPLQGCSSSNCEVCRRLGCSVPPRVCLVAFESPTPPPQQAMGPQGLNLLHPTPPPQQAMGPQGVNLLHPTPSAADDILRSTAASIKARQVAWEAKATPSSGRAHRVPFGACPSDQHRALPGKSSVFRETPEIKYV